MTDDVVQRFYAAFERRDGEAMAACYAPDAHFSDPVFGDLTGAEAGAMWRMLTRMSRDLQVELAEHDENSAHWIARYTFSATGRPVVNDVHARFKIVDGLIADHVDSFSFWKWSRQALGPKGVLLGWTPFVRAKVGGSARGNLDTFMAKEAKRA